MAANRYMIEMYADRYMYFNQDSGELTNEQDPRAVEYVYLYLKGQSFLFNQIRKMVGSLIQICRGSLGKGFINNCHRNNKLQIALSPGDGLLLEKVAYDKYNYLPQTSAPIMISLVSTKKEIQDFRNDIAGFIAQREFKDRAFTKWLSWFDDNRESMYIDWDPEDDKV
jgi:tRNA pseudouridine38-40 synthase